MLGSAWISGFFVTSKDKVFIPVVTHGVQSLERATSPSGLKWLELLLLAVGNLCLMGFRVIKTSSLLFFP